MTEIRVELVRIPAGEFLMGSDPAKDKHARDDEQPQRRVHLSEFYIAKYPLTNDQYAAFVKATNHRVPEHWEKGKVPQDKGNHPVVYVSWHDAVAFCQWLSQETGQPFRLPTEAEWEKAARGTRGLIYPWGDRAPTDELCNFGKHVGNTTPVGRYSPRGDSPYGCADMAGNVSEWVSDWYGENYYAHAPSRDPQGPDWGWGGYRVLRGGSWLVVSYVVRSAHRYGYLPDSRNGYVSFRCAGASTP